jgi:mono/diheme cytochrome c family protein
MRADESNGLLGRLFPLLWIFLVPLLACSDSESEMGRGNAIPSPDRVAIEAAAAPETPAPTRVELVARGRRVYMGNCTACHNADPAKPGSLGPEIVLSSRELLEARVIAGVYPEGYTPKKDTRLMVALPHLKDEIDALAAYLTSP